MFSRRQLQQNELYESALVAVKESVFKRRRSDSKALFNTLINTEEAFDVCDLFEHLSNISVQNDRITVLRKQDEFEKNIRND